LLDEPQQLTTDLSRESLVVLGRSGEQIRQNLAPCRAMPVATIDDLVKSQVHGLGPEQGESMEILPPTCHAYLRQSPSPVELHRERPQR
jgi:hypothetical protein